MKMIFFPPSFDEQIYYDESMPPIYDDYCDDTYALNNNDNQETCHLDFNFQLDYASHDSYFVEFAPTTIHENKFAYVESNKISMLVHHENNALCAGYMVEFIHDATENYYEGGIYACSNCNNVSVNSLNIHDANDMQSHKLWDAMFDQDDMFSPPKF